MNHRSFQTLTPSVWLLWLLWGSIVTDRSWMIDDLRKYEIRSDGGGASRTDDDRVIKLRDEGLIPVQLRTRTYRWIVQTLMTCSRSAESPWRRHLYETISNISYGFRRWPLISRPCLKVLWFVVTGLSVLVGGFLYLWPPSEALWSSSSLFFLLELLCNSEIQ